MIGPSPKTRKQTVVAVISHRCKLSVGGYASHMIGHDCLRKEITQKKVLTYCSCNNGYRDSLMNIFESISDYKNTSKPLKMPGGGKGGGRTDDRCNRNDSSFLSSSTSTCTTVTEGRNKPSLNQTDL